MEYLKDYDFELLCHPGKANVVADALSRKRVHMSSLMVKELELIEKLRDMNLVLQLDCDHIWCSMLTATNTFLEFEKDRGMMSSYNRLLDGWVQKKGRNSRWEPMVSYDFVIGCVCMGIGE